MISCCVSRLARSWTDENRMRYEGGQYYVKSPEEMAAAVSRMRKRRWKIRRRSQSAVMWRLNSA